MTRALLHIKLEFFNPILFLNLDFHLNVGMHRQMTEVQLCKVPRTPIDPTHNGVCQQTVPQQVTTFPLSNKTESF